MTMEGEGAWRATAGGAQAAALWGGLSVGNAPHTMQVTAPQAGQSSLGSGPANALAAWDFQWVSTGAPEQWAHVTGQLRWRGFDVGFAADGLLGVDGRLAAPSVASMPAHLQQLVLQHFAEDCLQALKGTALADMTLVALQWHEEPLPMEGEFEFTFKRAELPRSSRGRLTVFDRAGRLQLINALATLQWPMPAGLSLLRGRLQIGSTRLSPEDCAGLEVGDLVWLDDAEVAATGLRAQFIPSDESEAACFAWIKRSSMSWQSAKAGASSSQDNASGDAGVLLKATSPEMAVQRAWCQGAVRQQPLAQTALALPWQLSGQGTPRFEGQLLVVGRRLGLRVTRVL